MLPAGKVNNTTVALTLLLAVLGVSTVWGLGAATVASLVAVLGFNYHFLPPVGTLTIQDPQNWVALVAFLVTAVTASQLSERARRRTAEAESAPSRDRAALQPGAGDDARRQSPQKTIREFVNKVVQVFGCDAAAFYYLPTGEILRSGPESQPVSDHDLQAAAEIDDVSLDRRRSLATAPVRSGAGRWGASPWSANCRPSRPCAPW